MMDAFIHRTDKKPPSPSAFTAIFEILGHHQGKIKWYKEVSFGFCVQLQISANQVTVHLSGVDAQNHA